MHSVSGSLILFIEALIWGIQLGIAHNMLVFLVTDYVHEDVRGTAIGTYYLIAAVGSFVAGAGSGFVSHQFGIQAIFFSSLIVGLLAPGVMIVLVPKGKPIKSAKSGASKVGTGTETKTSVTIRFWRSQRALGAICIQVGLSIGARIAIAYIFAVTPREIMRFLIVSAQNAGAAIFWHI